MLNLMEFINYTLGNNSSLLLVMLVAFFSKFFLLVKLIIYDLRRPIAKRFLFLFAGLFIASLFSDLTWIVFLIRSVIIPNLDVRLVAFFGRLGWIGFLAQNQLLIFFIETIIVKKFSLKKRHIVFFSLTTLLALCWLWFACFRFSNPSQPGIFLLIEERLAQLSSLLAIPLFIATLFSMLKINKTNFLPIILTRQLKLLVNFFIAPYLLLGPLTNKLILGHFIMKYSPIDRTALLTISTVLLTVALFYCFRRIMRLRFLNFNDQVQANYKFNFIDDFKDVLEHLSQISSLEELTHVTQIFFKAAFAIQPPLAQLYMRRTEKEKRFPKDEAPDLFNRGVKVDHFISTYCRPEHAIGSYLLKTKILTKDEIEFSNFYDEHEDRTHILSFLDSINADIFLPVFEREAITAYIIVERNARTKQLYSCIEQDEMHVFSSYLSNTINILRHSSLEALLKQEKERKEELYQKHQEVSHYKESIRSFLRASIVRRIGIVFYKARRFTYANQAAKELVEIDININEGDPLTQAFKTVARKVQDYSAPYAITTRDSRNNKIILSGLPSVEQNSVMIFVYYPEISDILRPQLDLLNDPSSWDHLLYLETTQAGQIINRFIPGATATLLNFKIDLLEAALNSKTLLLEMPEEDLPAVVDIVHHIGERQVLESLKLTVPEKNNEVAIKLFGTDKLFENQEETIALLQKVSTGTLFIHNVHLLSLTTQNLLAEYLNYGFYRNFKSDYKIFASTRIICSTTQNIQSMTTEGNFSRALYDVLKNNVLTMPSLMTLASDEIKELLDGLTEQTLNNKAFKTMLQLTSQEKEKLLTNRPTSIYELKDKVQQLMQLKATKNNIDNPELLDIAYNVNDPEIAQAVRLGKKALQDPHIMQLLWQKFKNQTKIALVLGVNKSSVNRRFKVYDFTEH